MHVGSYPKIYNLGHAAIHSLLLDEVLVEEKIDGSQFSFGLLGGELQFRSRGATIQAEDPKGMFKAGVDVVMKVKDRLAPGLIYRGEYLSKPKHNVLAYSRTPDNFVMIFDIQDTNLGQGCYMSPTEKRIEATRLGFETVPTMRMGKIKSFEEFKALMDQRSVLGGCNIEGVVIKNYSRFGVDGKALMGKYVSEAFKEVHQGEWRKMNPTGKDIITAISDNINKEARWEKAVQHLREIGELANEPKDIGALFKAVIADTREEDGDAIMEALFKWAWKGIGRNLTNGLAEWYKERLAKAQFTEVSDAPALAAPSVGGDAPAQSENVVNV